MKYDFDEIVPRRGTDSVKWDVPQSDDTMPLWIADMDFRSPPCVVDAVRRRAESGVYGYALAPERWHASLARWLLRRHGWKLDTSWMLDSSGLLAALAAVVRALCGDAGRIVLQTPAYNGFIHVLKDLGCDFDESPLRRVPARGGEGDFTYEMDFGDLERRLSDPRIRAFLLCNPHNPAGRSWTEDELRRVAGMCARRGIVVVSDEIHADLQMPGFRHVPLAPVADAERAKWVVFTSATKSFNIAGLHASVAIVPDAALRERVARVQRAYCTHELNVFGFVASEAAWEGGEEWLDELRAYVKGNYDELCAFLRGRMPQLKVAALESTYLAWVDATALGLPSADLERRLESEAKVKYGEGAIYEEPPGTSFLRVNLACPRALLREALERTARWVAANIQQARRIEI